MPLRKLHLTITGNSRTADCVDVTHEVSYSNDKVHTEIKCRPKGCYSEPHICIVISTECYSEPHRCIVIYTGCYSESHRCIVIYTGCCNEPYICIVIYTGCCSEPHRCIVIYTVCCSEPHRCIVIYTGCCSEPHRCIVIYTGCCSEAHGCIVICCKWRIVKGKQRGKQRATDRGFCGKVKRKRQLERPWRRWDGNIKMCVEEIESNSRYVKVAGSCAHGNEHADCIKCW
jgi:hypothetical protein